MRVLWLGRAHYQPVLLLQQRLRAQVLAGGEETILFVEHPSVITLGHRATAADLLVPKDVLQAAGIETVRVQRGGQATYHGPGQLVVYPVVRLRGGVVGHVDWLTESAVATAARLGVPAEYRPDPVGVWVGDRKLGAVGVHVEHQVAIHGLSLNVTVASTEVFRQRLFVPCGARGAQVTSLVEEGASRALTTHDVAMLFAAVLLSQRELAPLPLHSCSVESLLDLVPTAVAR